jgi:hypothetical protein
MSLPVPRLRRALAVIVLSAAVLGVLVPASALAQNVRARGETTLQPSASFGGSLVASGYTLDAQLPARLRPPVIAFPVRSGRLRRSGGRLRGLVNHRGGVRFRRGAATASVTDPTLVLGRSSYVSGRLGAGRVRFLELSSPRLRSSRGRLSVSADARLSATAATALNVVFTTNRFGPGPRLGRLTLRVRR